MSLFSKLLSTLCVFSGVFLAASFGFAQDWIEALEGETFERGEKLYAAIALDDMEALVDLLAAGEMPDATPELLVEVEGLTPLMVAARMGNVEAVQLLLEAGANPLATDDDDRTPAWYAVFGEQYDTFALLMEQDGMLARIDLPDSSTGNTMLHAGVMTFEPRIVEVLVEMGASQEIRNRFRRRPADICKLTVTTGCEALP